MCMGATKKKTTLSHFTAEEKLQNKYTPLVCMGLPKETTFPPFTAEEKLQNFPPSTIFPPFVVEEK